MVYCAALNCWNCTHGAFKNRSISFHGFPLQNEPLLRQWVQNMGRDMETPSKYERLCSEHFEESSFETQPSKSRKNRRLLKEAVPKKFLLGEDGNWLLGTPQGFCGMAPGMFPRWPRLQDWQNEFYKLLLKEKYGSLITLGKDHAVPKSLVPTGGEEQVKNPQDLVGRKIPASLSTGHGGATIPSHLQATAGTQLHGSPQGASRAPHCHSSGQEETPASGHDPAANAANPAAIRSGNSVLAGRELDEFRRFLLHHQGRPEEAAVPWFICTQCGKSFARHAYLLRHQRTHSGQRPHACAECGRRFLAKPALNSHLRTHFHIIRVPKAFPG